MRKNTFSEPEKTSPLSNDTYFLIAVPKKKIINPKYGNENYPALKARDMLVCGGCRMIVRTGR